MSAIGVGSTIWIFDSNHRVYPPWAPGRALSGAPIWRGHWVARQIIGETARSWIIGPKTKIPKRGSSPSCVAFSQQDIDRAEWVHDHKYLIERAVGLLDDFDKLRTIADLIGYQYTRPMSASSSAP